MTSNLTLNHRRPWATINLFLSRREDLEPAPTASGSVPRIEQQLPSLSIGFPTRTLGHKAGPGRDSFLPFLSTTYLAASARFVNQHNINVFLEPDSLGNPAQAETTDVRSVYQQQFTLSDSRRVFGFVNVGPAFRTTQVVFDHDVTGKSPSAGATWGVGGSASMTIYGTSKGGIGPVTSFRHVFNPSVAYSYQPDFPSLRVEVPTSDTTFATVNRFPSVAGIGLSGAQQSFLSFSLANRFEAKVKSGDREKSLSNLLSVNFNSAYDFLWRQSGRSTPWRPITTTVRVQPPSYVSGDLTLSHDLVYDKPLQSAQASIGLRFSGGGATQSVTRIPLAGNEAQTARPTDPLIPWSLSTSFSYSGSRSANGPWSHREFANAVLGLRPTHELGAELLQPDRPVGAPHRGAGIRADAQPALLEAAIRPPVLGRDGRLLLPDRDRGPAGDLLRPRDDRNRHVRRGGKPARAGGSRPMTVPPGTGIANPCKPRGFEGAAA